jgi:hypothetical protein
MKAIIAIVCVGLWMGVEPASAQTSYQLKVGRHPTVMANKSPAEVERIVDKILSDASQILQNNPVYACNVTFTRNGPVGKLKASTPAKIKTMPQRDAVHREDFDIKIVKEIYVCRSDDPTPEDGCSWPPEARDRMISSIFVESPSEASTLPNIGRLWAHELGHRMGLVHDANPRALMYGGAFSREAEVTEEVCGCFRKGPYSCSPGCPLCPR